MGFKHFIFKNWSKSIGVSFQMIAFFGPIFYCTLSLRLFAVEVLSCSSISWENTSVKMLNITSYGQPFLKYRYNFGSKRRFILISHLKLNSAQNCNFYSIPPD